jgi:hypothetical protein
VAFGQGKPPDRHWQPSDSPANDLIGIEDKDSAKAVKLGLWREVWREF